MKFERGRKKNQLIWSFILKDIASQSSVLNKTRKRKRFDTEYAFGVGDTYSRIYASTYPVRKSAWVTDSGSKGPTGQV